MTWTNPRTWAVNEVVSASLFNTHIRDNSRALAHPYDYAPADLDVSNTAAETTLYSKTITGNDLGPNGMLVLEMQGDYVYSNSTLDTHTLRVKFGGSTLLIIGPTSHGATSGTRFAWWLDVRLFNRAATNSQLLAARLASSDSYAGPFFSSTPVSGTGGIDTTADQTLLVTAQWSSASVNNSWRKRVAVLQLAQN